jgi:hypothetical protein
MKTWFTHPKNPFDSFYYYDELNKIFVRIRLELNRVDGGNTQSMYRKNRYVGFSKTRYNSQERQEFIVKNGQIYYMDTPLSKDPQEGYYVYDFSSENGVNPDNTPHIGNPVTLHPILPESVTADNLEVLARKTIVRREDIVLTPSNATEIKLSEAIKDAIKLVE